METEAIIEFAKWCAKHDYEWIGICHGDPDVILTVLEKGGKA